MSISFARPVTRLPSALPLILGLWGAYMLLLTSYCLIYQLIVVAEMPDVAGMAFWIVRDWGICMLITPFVFRGFQHYSARPGARLIPVYLWVSGLALLTALLLRMLVDAFTQAQGPASILVIYSTRYVAAMAVITLFWHVFLRPQAALSAPPQILLVSKGKDKCLVQVDDIQHVSAAGNYVEIHSKGQVYLLRATMKQVEALLPAGQFVRVHRSHIVRLEDIDRIKTQAAGNGTVYLRSGQALSLSKACRAKLKQLG